MYTFLSKCFKIYLTIFLILIVGVSQSRGQEKISTSLTESVDNQFSAEVDNEERKSPRNIKKNNPEILIVGGGSSHNYERWFNLADSKILSDAGANVRYTSNVKYIMDILPQVDILYLSNNQSIPGSDLREAIFDFVKSGNNLIVGHAATWYNWSDWPAYNKDLVGGGSRGHDEFGSFEVQVVNPDHPVMDAVPASFQITDELYHFEAQKNGSEIEVLAKGIEPDTGNEFPVVWTVNYGKGHIICFTLGHDGKSHNHAAYQQILQNSLSWFQQN